MSVRPINESDPTSFVVCKECGKKLSTTLHRHLKSKHGMSVEQYRFMHPGAEVASTYSVRRVGIDEKDLDSFIVCQECNQKMTFLNWTHLKIHGLTIDTYLLKHPGAQTICKRSSEKLTVSHKVSAVEQFKDPNQHEICRRTMVNSWVNGLLKPSNKRHRQRNYSQYVGICGSITMRSSWESRFAIELDELGVLWEYEKYCFEYMFEGLVRRYTPDFYLPDFKLFIEVKPVYFVDKVVLAKLEAVRSLGHDIQLLTEYTWVGTLERLGAK